MKSEPFRDPTWYAATPRFRQVMVRKLIRDAVVLAIIAVTLEIFLRQFVPSARQFIFTSTLTGGFPFAENSHGLRNVEFPPQRPAGETRILCLGNSTTWGSGVARDTTYPRQLQDVLNMRPGGPYFAINVGGEGATFARLMGFLHREGFAYEPAIAVLLFSPSMLASFSQEESVPTGQAGIGVVRHENSPKFWAKLADPYAVLDAGRKATRRSYALAFLDRKIRGVLYRMGVLKDRQDDRSGAVYAYAFDVPGIDVGAVETSYQRFGRNVDQLRRDLEARGVHFLVAGIPSRFEISDLAIDNERNFDRGKIRIWPHERVGAEMKRLGIPFLDLFFDLAQERLAMAQGRVPWNDLYVNDYIHLNPYGYRIVADRVAGILHDHGWLPLR